MIADESCLIEEDVDRCSGFFHGINIKLSKCGGMTPARRMIGRARRLGMKVMIGCMTRIDGRHLGHRPVSAAVGLCGHGRGRVDRQDVASGVRLDKGRVVFPQENGNGVRLL